MDGSAPTTEPTVNVPPHDAAADAAIVRECVRRRVLIAAFQRCTAELYAGSLSAQDAWSRMKEVCIG